jgi:hypothetical protein
MAVNWTFIGEQEGAGICKGYVPVANTSESGVTIATGVDLGQRSAASLAALGLSAALQARLAPYCGMRKQAAQAFLDANPLTITTAECAEIDNAIRATHLVSLVAIYNSAHPVPPKPFDQIPDRAQTVIASVAFQYGDLSSRCPHFWSTAVRQNWSGMISELEHFGDAYGPRRLREANYLRPVLTA